MPCVFQLVSLTIITIMAYTFPSSHTQMTSEARTDITNFVKTTSLACQRTVYYCIALSREAQILLSNAKYCYAMRLEYSGVTARHCLVNLGFCTEYEFNLMENQACGKTGTGSDQIRLEILFPFYDEVNATSESCLENLISFIKDNPLATLYKQQKTFCYLMEDNSTSATEFMLQGGSCTQREVDNLREIACNGTNTSKSLATIGDQNNRLSETVHASSQACQTRLARCLLSGGEDVLETLMKERYCWLIDVNEEKVFSARNCLMNSGQCTDAEMLALKQAACDSYKYKPSSISLLCSFIVLKIYSYAVVTK